MLIHRFLLLGNGSCVALPPASMQSSLAARSTSSLGRNPLSWTDFLPWWLQEEVVQLSRII